MCVCVCVCVFGNKYILNRLLTNSRKRQKNAV